MRLHRELSVFTALIGMVGIAALAGGLAAQGGAPQPAAAASPGFELHIPSFPDGGDFPLQYSDSGKRMNPEIRWTDPPKGTVSFVLNFHDQNNARNRTTDDMLDWIVWNIPADARELPEGVPEGPQLADGGLQTSASGPGTYRGPGYTGGPTGMGAKHHYTFDLYALDIKLDVPVNGEPFETRMKVFQAMQGHVLGKAVYMGLFRRPPGPEPPGSRTAPGAAR